MEIADEELIKEYLKGNDGSFKRLIDRYAPSIYNFSARLAGKENAEDIAQDTFIKVWRNIKKFNIKKAKFKTWLFTIARNTATDFLRKKKAIKFSDLDREEEPFDETIADDAILPDESIQKIQDKDNLDELLKELPLHYRTVLDLYYEEDMTFAEIGKVLKKPLNTVKSHHRRALAKLRQMAEQ